MSSSGPNPPGASVNNTSNSGTRPWSISTTSPTPASTGIATLLGPSTSEYYQTNTFGFSVPLNATIRGVAVNATKFAGGSGVADATVASSGFPGMVLQNAGTVLGTDQASATAWGSATNVTYGGPTNLWGATLTPAIVNSVNFGFLLAVHNSSSGGFVPISLDNITMTVYYTVPVAMSAGSVASAQVSKLTTQFHLPPGVSVATPMGYSDLPPPGYIKAIKGIVRSDWGYDPLTGQVHYPAPPGSPALVNGVPDPSLEYDTPGGSMPAQWSVIDNGTTRQAGNVSTSWAASGANSLYSQSSFSGAASGSNAGINQGLSYLAAASGGQPWSARAAVNVLSLPTPSLGLQLGIRFYDNTVTVINQLNSNPVGAGISVLSLENVVSPVNAAFAQLTIRAFVTGTGSGVLQFFADAMMLVPTAELDPSAYFDGDTGGGRWLGTPGSSASELPGSPYLSPLTLCVDDTGDLTFFVGDLRPGQEVLAP